MGKGASRSKRKDDLSRSSVDDNDVSVRGVRLCWRRGVFWGLDLRLVPAPARATESSCAEGSVVVGERPEFECLRVCVV